MIIGVGRKEEEGPDLEEDLMQLFGTHLPTIGIYLNNQKQMPLVLAICRWGTTSRYEADILPVQIRIGLD